MRVGRAIALTVIVALVALFTSNVALAADGTITIALPDSLNVTSAVANDTENKVETAGTVKGHEIRFEKLSLNVPYDLKLTLKEGTVLQGVNMAWHSDEPDKADAGPLSEDDKAEILKIVTEPAAFTNINQIIHLVGNHNRAVALMRLIRDKEFYADKGGEIIWRIEIYYFEYQAGGWEKVKQMNKVLRRERFRSREEFDKATKHLKFVPQIGGIVLSDEQKDASITLPANAGEETPRGPDGAKEEE